MLGIDNPMLVSNGSSTYADWFHVILLIDLFGSYVHGFFSYSLQTELTLDDP